MIQNLLNTIKVSVCRNPVWEKGFAMTPHSHSTLEIVYIRRGVMTIYYGEKELTDEITLSSGQFAVLFPHTAHRYCSETPQCEFLILELLLQNRNCSFSHWLRSETFLSKVPQLLELLHANTLILSFTDSLNVLEQLQEIHRIVGEENFAENPLSRIHYSIALERLLYSVCSCRVYYFNAAGNIHVRKCMLLIRDGYMGDLSVGSLASAVGVSPSYLQRLFKNEFHLSVLDVIQLQRLGNACRLLRMTDAKLTEIAARSGFRSASAFSKAFVKEYGQTPGDYRKLYIERTKDYTDTPKDYFDTLTNNS